MEFFRNPKINFVGAMKPAFTISMILLIGLAGVADRCTAARI